jgi:hypothetical protein
LDIFFGDGNMGAIPPTGASIVVEYIVTNGYMANISKETLNGGDAWEWESEGMLSNG